MLREGAVFTVKIDILNPFYFSFLIFINNS